MFFQFQHPKTHIDECTEISSIMGSDTTPNGIKFQFTDRFRPIAKRQLDMKAAGLDPKDVNLDSAKGKGAQGQSS
jgi:hypothetical protein